MPDLRHVADLVASELHYVDIVRRRLLAGRLTRTAGTGVSTRKDSIGSDIVSLGVGDEGFHLLATVRHSRDAPLKRKLIKQSSLFDSPISHHDLQSCQLDRLNH